MNWFSIPTLLLGLVAYFLGQRWLRCVSSVKTTSLYLCVALILALPAFFYAAYYSRLLGEPVWLYRLRTIPSSELLAGFAGFAAAWLQIRFVPPLKLSPIGSRLLVPVILIFIIALPYLKPICRPLRTSKLQDRWEDGVCMQSSFSTCGPASAATVLRYLGVNVSERELAQESFTCASGTENWYLARALRRRGFTTAFKLDENLKSLPAIAGVRMKSTDNSGHFIAVLERQGNRFVIGDPMEGRSIHTFDELRDKYEFTGFVMMIGHGGFPAR